MSKFIFFRESDFEYVGNKYQDKHLLSRITLQKRLKRFRISYYLPNGNRADYNSVPELRSKKEREDFIATFRQKLIDGFLPVAAAKIIKAISLNDKDGNFETYTEKYFGVYATDEYKKLKKSERTARSYLNRCLEFFKLKGYISISQITEQDLTEWDRSLLHLKKIKGKGLISRSTRNNLRKRFRAFLWMAQRKGYLLQCKPENMNIYERVKGEIDPQADVRSIIFPQDLIQSCLKSKFQSNLQFTADIKKIPQFIEYTGLRPGEFFTLSDYNINMKNNRPFSISIIDLPTCPYEGIIGFSPKKFCSYRTIELTDFCVDFLEETMKNVKKLKRYGIVGKQLIQFPFLFAFYSQVHQEYISNDYLFYKEFRRMVDFTIEEFNLPYVNIYELYDLRRSCNHWLKTELGYSDERASQFLGHSKGTNNKHYTLDEKRQQIKDKRGTSALDNAINSSPEIASLFSYRQNKSSSRNLKLDEVSSLVPNYGNFVIMTAPWDIEKQG